jgi:hypothetical protein
MSTFACSIKGAPVASAFTSKIVLQAPAPRASLRLLEEMKRETANQMDAVVNPAAVKNLSGRIEW